MADVFFLRKVTTVVKFFYTFLHNFYAQESEVLPIIRYGRDISVSEFAVRLGRDDIEFRQPVDHFFRTKIFLDFL